MEYKIKHVECKKAQRGWIIEIEARFPTRRQFTWETKGWINTGVMPCKPLIPAIIKFWWLVRKEIKAIQALSGEFELS